MHYKPENTQTERFANELRKMGMDEDSIEINARKYDVELTQVAKAKKLVMDMDKEEKLEQERKGMDLSEESKSVLKNEKELNNDSHKKGKDEDMKDKDMKDKDMKGMDMAAIEELITKKIADYDLSCKSKGKAMDEALSFYKSRYNTSIACDSADAVYDAILRHENISIDKNASLDMKKGMVSMLGLKSTAQRNFVVGDSSSVKTPDEYLKELGV